MRLRLCALVVFLMASSALRAMEVESAPSTPLTEPQQAILLAIEHYQDHLIDSLGCVLCAWFEKKVETDHYLHVRDRITQLCALRNLVKANDWQEKSTRMLSSMGAFRKLHGQRFRSACVAALKRARSPHDDSEETCVACWENRRFVKANPCNHLLYCKSCLANLTNERKLPKSCAMCRTEIAQYESLEEIFDTCIDCMKDACMLAPDCGHVVLCATCAPTTKACPLCDKACKQFEQVYR